MTEERTDYATLRAELEQERNRRARLCLEELRAAMDEICTRHNCTLELVVRSVPVGNGAWGNAADIAVRAD